MSPRRFDNPMEAGIEGYRYCDTCKPLEHWLLEQLRGNR